MTSKMLALKLADLGVTKSHSRPYVSDDNPFSESQFKTMKYRPEFPDRFGSLEDARAHGQGFFHWYNLEHHHSGIAMLTPHMVQYRLAAAVLDDHQRVLTAAFQQHPERFVRKPPQPAPLPDAVWINRKRQRNYRVDRGGGWDYRLRAAQAEGVSSASR
jgi:putative transposase